MGIKLPLIQRHRLYDRKSRECVVEIKIEQTLDFSKYPPDGVKCIFRFLREMATTDNKYELMFLIDNHAPFGFHMHDKLPRIHDSRFKN